MQVIGFNFTRVSAQKNSSSKKLVPLNTNIEFSNIERETVPLLKENDALKISFKFSVSYSDTEKKNEDAGQILFEGDILVAAEEKDSKDIIKSWKNKELPNQFKIPMFNLILKKCSVKAMSLEEELNLPTHINIPILKAKTKQ